MTHDASARSGHYADRRQLCKKNLQEIQNYFACRIILLARILVVHSQAQVSPWLTMPRLRLRLTGDQASLTATPWHCGSPYLDLQENGEVTSPAVWLHIAGIGLRGP